jgi:hypothetical protein
MTETSETTERNLGPQPVEKLMAEHNLKATDLVAASTEQITHKMVARACKGRMLTRNIQIKILNALNKITGKTYVLKDLFTY